MSDSNVSPRKVWYLEGPADERKAWRTEVSPLPFRVGRRPTCHLRLSSPSVSGEHAQLVLDATGRLCIDDLGSTNGTFLNLQRVEETTRVEEGDVIHFADQEFRVCGDDATGLRSTAAVSPEVIKAMRGDAARRHALREYIDERRFGISFQPIVSLEDDSVYGHEALGRSVVQEFFSTADEMFSEAEGLSLSVELSEALRVVTAAEANELPKAMPLFVNTHPFELQDARRLLQSLDEFLETLEGGRPVVLEIHEMAITELERFERLRQELADRDVRLAFDDFGRGQSRFLELVDLEPEFVKFDRSALAGGLTAGDRRFEMIATMVSLVHKMGQKAIAEGIETTDERRLCEQLGFDYGQGFLLGRPRPADEPSTFDGVHLRR